MMSEASYASLGPTLLARKGGAKPAMRPQLTPLPDNLSELAAIADEQLEDLGWNDMGSNDTVSNEMGSEGAASEGVEHGLILNKPQPVAAPFGHDFADEGGSDYEDEDDCDDEDAESGPFEIIDPLAGAVVVPFGAHGADRAAARRPAANQNAANEDVANEDAGHEDWAERASPVVVKQQQNLARRIEGDTAQVQADHTAAGDAADHTAAGDVPLLWQKPARAPRAQSALLPTEQRDHARPAAPRAGSNTGAITGANNARRTAFTLRLDTDRHLKLRLAATMQGVSAQALVTEALDAMLGDIEELDAFIARMKRD